MGFIKGMISSFMILIAICSATQGEITATTDNGKKVILNEDGTWRYRESITVTKKSDTANAKLRVGSWKSGGILPIRKMERLKRNPARAL